MLFLLGLPSVCNVFLSQEEFASAPSTSGRGEGEGLRISVHGVPNLLGAEVADWEKFAFGYRYVRADFVRYVRAPL